VKYQNKTLFYEEFLIFLTY